MDETEREKNGGEKKWREWDMTKYHHQLQLTMLTLYPPQRDPQDLLP